MMISLICEKGIMKTFLKRIINRLAVHVYPPEIRLGTCNSNDVNVPSLGNSIASSIGKLVGKLNDE